MTGDGGFEQLLASGERAFFKGRLDHRIVVRRGVQRSGEREEQHAQRQAEGEEGVGLRHGTEHLPSRGRGQASFGPFRAGSFFRR